jgi:hypothetical protein
MKRLTLLLALFAIMSFSLSASADDISFSGGVGINQTGSIGTPAVNFTFAGLTVTPGTLGGDALEGTAVTITPNTAFSFTSVVGSNGYFSPNSGSMSIGNGTTGTLTGDIQFVTITGNGAGSFAISIGLSNINITGGTSAFLTSLAGTTNGSGVFTFQFTAGGGLTDLLNMGLGSGSLANTSTINTSVSGSVAVPEPASLFLLGSGLMAGGGFVRRKFKR